MSYSHRCTDGGDRGDAADGFDGGDAFLLGGIVKGSPVAVRIADESDRRGLSVLCPCKNSWGDGVARGPRRSEKYRAFDAGGTDCLISEFVHC